MDKIINLTAHCATAKQIYNRAETLAFSKRVSGEIVNADGTVTKTSVFKHLGFIEA